jgi:hypothetical protein
MRLKLPTQVVLIVPDELMAMPYTDIGRLVGWIRGFVSKLTELPIGHPHARQIEPFTFVPMQLDFEFACLEGDVTKDLDGVVSLRVMLNLRPFSDEYKSEYIGVETDVDPKQLIEFTTTLEQEADRVINSRYAQEG